MPVNPNLATMAAPPCSHGPTRGASSHHLLEIFQHYYPQTWAYNHPWGLILHPSQECEICFAWSEHYSVQLYKEIPSLVVARKKHNEIWEEELNATREVVREKKDGEIAELRRQVKELQQELEKARQAEVSPPLGPSLLAQKHLSARLL